jgi:hypothetical protein
MVHEAKGLVSTWNQMNRLLSILLLCLVSFAARADYLWTWNGDSGLFQGKFETTADEMQPGAVVLNGFFDLSITSPTGVWISNLGTGEHTMFTYYNSTTFTINVFGPNGMNLVSDSMGMSEQLGNTSLFGEQGCWSITFIPEPCSAALLVLGGSALLIKRKRAVSAPRT